jgi:hypothetical protein
LNGRADGSGIVRTYFFELFGHGNAGNQCQDDNGYQLLFHFNLQK